MSECEHCRAKADALLALMQLLDDGDLVRNIEGDAEILKFLRQGRKIATALLAAKNALEPEKTVPNSSPKESP